MLVHFPAALFPFEFVCAAGAAYTGSDTLAAVALPALAVGAVAGWAAVLTGALDLVRVYQKNPAAVRTAIVHAGLNSCVIIVYTVLAYARYKSYPENEPDDAGILVLKALLISLLGAGNYFGGRLILKYRVAVEE